MDCWAITLSSAAGFASTSRAAPRGAGAYICGEEAALFNSIEGYRGERAVLTTSRPEIRPVPTADHC